MVVGGRACVEGGSTGPAEKKENEARSHLQAAFGQRRRTLAMTWIGESKKLQAAAS